MSFRDHSPLTVTDFRGIFARGGDDTVPMKFFSDSRNNKFPRQGVNSREGSSLVHAITSVRRIEIYKRIGEAQRLLILDGTGKLFDSTNLAAPILNIAAMTDFSSETMFNRAYITPHNGVTGLPGEKVYVYNGSGTARPAAGAAPTSTTLTLSDSGVSGSVEAGTHLIAVAFETDSGFLTGLGGFQQINNAGGKKLNVDTIPTGPAGTVARVLVSSQIVTDFNGDFEHQTYFFIPNGRIGNNVTTTLNDTIDYFDADLEDDASYLLDQLETIPAGVGIGNYAGRLITWGEDANPSIIRASIPGEPESHTAADGFVTVNPGDNSAGIKYCFGYTPLLIVQKSNRTYYTQDNGDVPATWSVPDPLDSALGAEPHSVAQILDFGERLENVVVTAHKTGIRTFGGNLAAVPLTFAIDDIWSRITKTAFNTVELAIDANNYAIYAVVPLDGATSPSHILYGDFNEGLNSEDIKWDLWTLPNAPRTITVDVVNATGESVVKFGSLDGNVYKFDEAATNDYGTAIQAYVEVPLLPTTNDDSILHFTGCRIRVKGSGLLHVTARGLDSVTTATGESITLSATPGKSYFSGFNFTGERCAVKLSISNSGEFYELTRFSLYVSNMWEQRGVHP